MARKKPGDGIGYTAAEWNRHEDAANYVEQRSLGRGGGDAARLLRTDIIRIKNSSGAARRKGEILKLGNLLIADSLILKEGREQLRFDTALHDGTDAPFCVLLDPVPDGGRGRAQIAGVCPALVNFTHADQRYARPANANDVLQAGAVGQVRVLHKGGSGTGEKECVVELGNGRFQAWGVADQDIPAGSTDTVSIHNESGDTLMDEEVKALGLDLTETKKVWIELTYNKLYGFPLEC